MKRITFVFTLLSVFFVCNAQQQINITDVNVLNLGDGQIYIHYLEDKNKPVTGKIRLITGYSSEYVDYNLKDGYPNGKVEHYKKDKLKETLNFKNGYLDGKQTYHFPSGDVEYQAEFKNGKKDGEWVYFNRDGGKREMEVYVDGDKVRKVTYYTNGNIDMERHYKKGKQDGFSRTYTQDGDLKSEVNYVNGKKIGKEKILMSSNNGSFLKISHYNDKGVLDGEYTEEWAENKKPKTKGKYINGQKDGIWKEWYSNGEIRRDENYKNGVLQQ